MNLSRRVATELPLLRFYARAAMRSQPAGDAVVRITLEELIQNPSDLPAGGNLRRSLLTKCSKAITTFVDSFPGFWDGVGAQLDAVGLELAGLTIAERQVVVLSTIEGFSIPETAEILSISVKDASELLASARSKLGTSPVEETTATAEINSQAQPTTTRSRQRRAVAFRS